MASEQLLRPPSFGTGNPIDIGQARVGEVFDVLNGSQQFRDTYLGTGANESEWVFRTNLTNDRVKVPSHVPIYRPAPTT